MAVHLIANVARLTVRFTGPQLQTMSFGTYWRLVPPASWTLTDVDGLAGDADVTFSSILKNPHVPTSIQYVGCEARSLDIVDGPVAFHGENAGAGGHLGTLLPTEVAALWSLRSIRPGRSHRNRAYWPGVNTSEMTTSGAQGVFDAGFASAMTSALSSWVAAIEAGGTFKQVVASPKLGTYDEVTSRTVSVRPASQRRREA